MVAISGELTLKDVPNERAAMRCLQLVSIAGESAAVSCSHVVPT